MTHLDDRVKVLADSLDTLEQSIRETITALIELPVDMETPEVHLLRNLRAVLDEWEQANHAAYSRLASDEDNRP